MDEENREKNPYSTLQHGCTLLRLALDYLFALLLRALLGSNIGELSFPF
ncbi:hypothetical protein JHU38_08855 [Prevotella sp. A2931]|uniref:Uncharacterized protein n=1 Tax=Prevotella illustrans TaxID=2800387 RepID=A0ABS3M6X3_9BACT|nr:MULTISPECIES: hypothetical protein [Prevotella]MBO1363875.1 hypothetical protein [Prevotella illustrans]